MIEVHGKRDCPFAWRVRITAREKGLPFEWIVCDAPKPDARAAARNPDCKSPRLWEDGFTLIESLVIVQYLDEAHPDRPLQALSARERAQMRLRLEQLRKLENHLTPERPADDKVRRRVSEGHEALDRFLADGRVWLGGGAPDLSDVASWPFLRQLEDAGLRIPDRLDRAAAYWRRASERESLQATRP